jgi:hypothetical protein
MIEINPTDRSGAGRDPLEADARLRWFLPAGAHREEI